MRVKLHQSVEGHSAGDTVDLDEERATWLVSNGYAVAADGSDAPAQSASKAEWVDYAVSLGADRDEAEAVTKAELIERHGQ